MNNETDLQSGTADGNSTRVITFQSNSTPLATDIDNFSLEQYTNQLSTTATSTLVEGLLNSVSEAISDAVGNITSSLSGNESASLHSSLASNSGNFPVIHNETIGNTAENFLPGGSSKEACVLLNTFIFLLPFLSLLIIIPLAAFLYDKTPLGTCYNRVCDLLCGIPEEDEQDNGDGNETYGDIEKGAYAGGTRRTNSDHRDCAKNKKKKNIEEGGTHIILGIPLSPNLMYESLALLIGVMKLEITFLTPHYMRHMLIRLRELEKIKITMAMTIEGLLLIKGNIKKMMLLRA